MNIVYKINKVILIINGVLLLTVYFGMLFLIITGITQILSYLYYLRKWKHIDQELKKYFIYYGISVPIVLSPFLIRSLLEISGELFWLPLVGGVILSICFIILSKKQKKYSEQLS